MSRPVVSAALALILSSCSVDPGLYDREDGDAVPIYRGLIGQVPKAPDALKTAYGRQGPIAPEVQAIVESYEVPLAALARAAAARRCTWTYDRIPAITGEYPIDYGLTLARSLIIRSRIRFARGDLDGGIADLLVLARFASDLLLDRWTMGKLVGLVALMLSQYEIRGHLTGGRLRPDQVEQLERHLSTLAARFPDLAVWLRDERWMADGLLEEIRDLGFGEVVRRVAKDPTPPESHPLVGDWDHWLRQTLTRDLDRARRTIDQRWDQKLTGFEEDFRQPFNTKAVPRRMAALKKENDALGRQLARTMLLSPVDEDAALKNVADLLLALWLPALEKIVQNHVRTRLLLDFNRLACVLERERRRTGSFPERLDAIGQAPKDPYVEGLLKYQRFAGPDGDGYVLASEGPDVDADRRIRALAETFKFDWDRFDRTGDDLEFVTLGVFRKRDSLR